MSQYSELFHELRTLEINLQGGSRDTIKRSLERLEAMAATGPAEIAAAARKLLRDYEQSAVAPPLQPLSNDEMNILAIINQAASWDVPHLVEIERIIPQSPTNEFPAMLARALYLFVDRFAQVVPSNRSNMRRFRHSIDHVAQKLMYKDCLEQPAARLRATVEALGQAARADTEGT